ncbi:MAG: hypothetical protein ABJB05_11370 [Parafilimonas sp.]
MATTSIDRLKDRLKPLQAEYIEWKLTPDEHKFPLTMRAWCEDHEVSYSTPGTWEQDSRVKEYWYKRVTEVGVTPDAIAEVLAALKSTATDPNAKNQVAAINAYLAYAQKVTPLAAPEVADDVRPSDLSDEELDALIAEQASTEVELRANG